jgi:hypothetical protein
LASSAWVISPCSNRRARMEFVTLVGFTETPIGGSLVVYGWEEPISDL